MATLKNTTIDDTGFITIPSGTITQRPSPAANGMIRYNTDLSVTEYFASNNWLDITTGKPPIVTSGLVLHLDAGDGLSYPGSGNTWFDISGNGNAGTLTNGPTYSSANTGSIVFDGTNDKVSIPNSSNWNFSSDFAIECWFYPNSLSTYNGLVVSAVTGGIWFGKIGSGFGLRSYAVADLIYSVSSPSLNYWHHVIATRMGSIISLYIDNILINSISDTRTFANGILYIGDDGGSGASWNGRISSVRLYKNKGLSATEVQQNFQALRGRYGI